MSDAEKRALRRAATTLLLLSLLRWMAAGGDGPLTGAGGDALPRLLESSQAALDDAQRREAPLGPGERIDPNSASEAALDRLPGVGAVTARAIVRSREEEGPFATPDDLLRVPGIGPAAVARLADHLELPAAIGGRRTPSAPRRTTLNVNRASARELQRLPGIGPALAARIEEARTERPFTSVDDLLRVPGIGAATLERLRSLVRAGPGR
jgi:competence ComEA-like helix-hairpin-helix protein